MITARLGGEGQRRVGGPFRIAEEEFGKIGAKMRPVNESVSMATGSKQPVPTVDAVHLRQALALVYTWADLGDDDGDPETMPGGDLHNLLERLARDLGVERDIAIALFKRSIALAAYCAEAKLPNSLFEDGFPAGNCVRRRQNLS